MIDINLLKGKLTDDDVKKVLLTLFSIIPSIENDDILIYPTICHNKTEETASHKLYYYKETKTFYCFTECHQSFDIIDLILSAFKVREVEKTFVEVLEEVAYLMNFEESSGDDGVYCSVKDYYTSKKLCLPEQYFDNKILNFFTFYPVAEWILDGISEESMRKYDIKFYPVGNQIIIPHYNDEKRLVGIRVRHLNKEEIAKGKYRPLTLEGKKYKHPVSQYCYGLWNTKKEIQLAKRAIIFEGEKSVLLSESFCPNLSVASCGSNISKAQILQLIKQGAKEITIAFDKEYGSLRESKSSKYFDKLFALASRYSLYCNMSFIFDFENLLSEKDSPIDKGNEVFQYLYSRRVKIT